jgi:hypothetical protein
VPEGWTATEPGYFGTLDDGRDTLAAIQTYRQTGEKWKAAYDELRGQFLTTTGTITGQVKALEKQLDQEREAWKARATRNIVLVVILAGGIGYLMGR